MKHTPWYYDDEAGHIYDNHDLAVASVIESDFTPLRDAVHASYIVHAVNAYDKLIAFLKNERELELEPGYPPTCDLRIKRIDDLLRELGE